MPKITPASSTFELKSLGNQEYGLELKQPLVWQTARPTESLHIICSNGFDTASIIILIQDVDNNAPEFMRPSYTLTMSEVCNMGRESVLLYQKLLIFQSEATKDKELNIPNLKATDKDDPAKQKINYTIVEGVYNVRK